MLFGALSLSGCGDGGTGEEISGTLARNSAAESGELAFDQAGHEIDGDLTCTDEGTGENLRVTCEGTTVDGGEARMVADAEQRPPDRDGGRRHVRGLHDRRHGGRRAGLPGELHRRRLLTSVQRAAHGGLLKPAGRGRRQ
ncbi:hypothetical protein LUW77_18915 [Streptomyces radiopugnans]|nr:hypothetical protein LUW77_18915 [Streptomyces radiopugnans]